MTTTGREGSPARPWSFAGGLIPLAFLLALYGALVGSWAQAQVGGLRISTCAGVNTSTWAIDAPILCGVNGYAEFGGVGVFAQTLPRFGAPWDNFEVYVYRPNVRFDLFGFQVVSWPGVAVGRELGETIIRVNADLIFTFDWRTEPE